VTALVLLCWAPAAPAVTRAAPKRIVRDVRVTGVKAVRPEAFLEWAGVRKGRVWTEQLGTLAMDSALRNYRDRGYWNARISEPVLEESVKGVVIKIEVTEGDPVVVGTVTVSGPESLPHEHLSAVLETVPGDRLTSGQMAADANALLDLFESRGYPYAEVDPDAKVVPGSVVVDVSWHVDPGPRVSIDAVRFSGNRVSKPHVLFRETGLSVGEVYDQRKVDEATRALRRLPFLMEVSEPEIEMDARSGRYVMHYHVEDTKSAAVEGALGLLPGNDGAYDWIGRFHFLSDNLAGSGRSAQFLWERPGLSSSDLRVAYGEPWLLGKPLYGDVSLWFEERPGYVEGGLGVGIHFRPIPGAALGITVARSTVRPDLIRGTSIDRQSTWSVSGEGEWDRRNSRLKPTQGWSGRLVTGWDRVETRTAIRSESDFSRLVYEASVERYQPLNPRTTFGLRLRGSGLFQDGRVSADALVRIGGSSTIRGYAEEHFLADHAAWANGSLIRDLGRRARGYLFVDVGRISTPVSAESNVWVSAVGYGAGLQTQTRTGMMTVEYGLSKDDSAGEGTIHVRMVGTF
jgi:outer membrane protein assembly factor BamA